MRFLTRFISALLICLSPAAFAQDPGTIQTIVGGGQTEGEGIPATDIALNGPSDAVLDAAGNIYIADRENHRVRKVDITTGTISTIAGTGQAGFSGDGGPATDAQLNTPQAITLDQSGNLYIADSRNRRIRKVDATTGTISTIAGTGERGVESAEGPAISIAFDDIVALLADGNEFLYISENAEDLRTSSYRVRRIDLATGTVQAFAGTGSPSFSGDGGPATEAGVAPIGLALDASRNVYISDFNNFRIRRVDITSGLITTLVGRGPINPIIGIGGFGGDGGPATDAFLNLPFAVTVDQNSTLYIADTGNQVIRAVDPETQTIVTLAGIPSEFEGFSGDGGLALDAQLGRPGKILIDSDNNLLFVDIGNNRIRKLFDPTFRIAIFNQITNRINFFRTTVGEPITRSARIANFGNAPLTVQRVTSNQPDFSILTPIPFQIGPLQEAEIQIRFAPPLEGPFEGLITITTDDPRTPIATVEVSGLGVAPTIGVQPDLLVFDRTFVSWEQALQIQISNLGEGTLIIPEVTSTDTQFIANLSDTLRIASGFTQSVSIIFRPTTEGIQEATLTIFSNDPLFPAFVLSVQGLSQIPKPGGFASVGPNLGMGDPGAGFGVAWGDYDADGDPDLYVVRSLEPNLLYRNDLTTFTETASTIGVDDGADGSAALWADYDNDGDLDVYVTNFGQPNRLFRNDGNRFTPVEDQTGVSDSGDGYGAAWADYDRDGDPDLYVANFGPNRFFQNNNGQFIDLADSLGLGDLESGIQPAWGDFDNDGDPDLFLANSGPNRLFRNDAGTFESIEKQFIPNDSGPSFGAAWGDVDNDNDLDLYIPYFNEQNRLYLNDGNFFRDVATTSGIAHTGRGRGAVWGDFDNDGDLDLYVTNSGEPNLFYRNSGGVFTEEADSMGVASTTDSLSITPGDPLAGTLTDTTVVQLVEDSRGVALADFDSDGGLDLYVAVQGGLDRLYQNQEANGNWLIVRPISTESSADAIGTRIEIVYNGDNGDQRAFREITGGASFLSQDALVASFGVGQAEFLKILTVRWPSGIVQQLSDNLIVNRIIEITEEASLPPTRLRLETLTTSLVANGMAETEFTVSVLNDENNIVLVSDRDIFFTLDSGEGIFVGGDSVRVSDGIATLRFRAGTAPGTAIITAASSDLLSDQVTIQLLQPFGSEELTIRTVAGSSQGFGDFAGDGGPATDAFLRNPRSVAVDSVGNIFIADSGNHRIRKVDAITGFIETFAGTGTVGLGETGNDGPATEAALANPRGVIVFPNGDLLLSESGGHVARLIFASNNTIVAFAGRATALLGGDGEPAVDANLNTPIGLATDSQGNVWIADRLNQRIRKVGQNGIITTVAGSGGFGPGAGGFSGDGLPATQAVLNNPLDVAVDSLGQIYIADTNNHRIRKVDTEGIITTIAGTGQAGFGGDGGPAVFSQLNAPAGLAIDKTGRLYVADRGNHRIRLLNLNTELIQTVAGTGIGQLDQESGLALEVSLDNPQGLSVGPTGTLFIADLANHRIRELSILFPNTPNLSIPSPGVRNISIDFNGDNRINLSDFLLFAAAFNTPIPDKRFDLNTDGLIDFADFLDFAVAFEQSREAARKP